jgi:hypothetical protein
VALALPFQMVARPLSPFLVTHRSRLVVVVPVLAGTKTVDRVSPQVVPVVVRVLTTRPQVSPEVLLHLRVEVMPEEVQPIPLTYLEIQTVVVVPVVPEHRVVWAIKMPQTEEAFLMVALA